MEFTTQYELYNKLSHVFKVKKRLMKYYKNQNITNEDIWTFLIENKWKKAYGLTLSEMINDIINLEVEYIKLGDKNERQESKINISQRKY